MIHNNNIQFKICGKGSLAQTRWAKPEAHGILQGDGFQRFYAYNLTGSAAWLHSRT